MTAGRVFFYVQHLLGIGHTMRAAALTRALQRAGLEVTYVSGGFDAVALDLAGAERRQLPPVRAADATFKTLVGDNGNPIDDTWRELRKVALLDAFELADPDIVLIEMFPFGRWPFRFELLPLLDVARRRQGRRPQIVCSVRDILVPKSDPKRLSTIVETIQDYFDAVLVHGDADFIRLDETFPRAPDIADRIRYTGYIAPPRESGTTAPRTPGEVIVSAGGGSTGGKLLRTALAARALSCLADRPWRILVGPNLPADDRAMLTPQPGITIEALRPDYRALLADCALSISQAGYNTVMDLLTCGARSILIPFSTHGQTEQAARAGRMAARGWTHVLPEEALNPDTLAATVARAMTAPPPAVTGLDLDGANRSAAILAGMVGQSNDREAPLVAHMPL